MAADGGVNRLTSAADESLNVTLGNQIVGLTGELALHGNLSKKAKDRLKKKLKKEQEEEESQK